LYYTASEAFGVFENFQVSIKGGESIPLPDYTRGMIVQDISPDKTELLLEERRSLLATGSFPLWVASVLGGAPRRLGELVESAGAAWAPDGQEVFYIQGRELYTANSDGSDIRRLGVITGTRSDPVVEVNGIHSGPRWSPDRSKIRFTLQDASQFSSIWEISRDGKDLHALLPGWRESHCCGSWTSDGKYFVFTSGGNLWAIRERTSLFRRASREPMQLTTGPMQLWGAIASPDSKRLFAVGRQPRTELVHYDPKSGQFLPYAEGISAEGLDFSTDGKWMAYVAYPEGSLWRAKADGSEREQLTFPPLRVSMPRWAPDGKQIAFMATLPGKPERIYLISSDGGAPQQVTNGESGPQGDFDPAWSPDGTSLAFGGFPYLGQVPTKLTIHLLDLKTRRISQLPGSDGLWSIRWSPNGNYIAALLRGSENLMLYDLRTHQRIELASAVINYPSWSRDSEFIYFDTAGSDPSFFRVRIRDRKIQRIVSLKDIRRTLGTFGPWTGVAPDGSLLLQRDAGASEIYALDWEAP
jgi:Tol biopolymer transport system component